jgi:hypothetical protein
MSEQYVYRESRRGSGSATLALLVMALLLGAVALGVFVHHARTGLPGRLAALIAGRTASTDSAPVVVEKIRRLNRLETVAYSLDTIVEGNESSLVFPDMLAGDRLLLIAHGQAIAGIDLSKIKPEDVQINDGPDGRSITLVLPPSELFITTLDNAKTRVYARDTGLLVKADPNLETTTRQKAQGQLQQAALSDGILDAARRNAVGTVTALLEGLGFSKVTVK